MCERGNGLEMGPVQGDPDGIESAHAREKNDFSFIVLSLGALSFHPQQHTAT